jgi:ankyrin repeat protein
MKFITRRLYEGIQPDSGWERRAERQWEQRSAAYDRHYRAIAPRLPASVRRLCDNGLHDAEVESASQPHGALVLVIDATSALGRYRGRHLRLTFSGLPRRLHLPDLREQWWLYEEAHLSKRSRFSLHVMFDKSDVAIDADALKIEKLPFYGLTKREAFARACMAGDTRTVRAELARGVDPNWRYRGRTLLNWAAQEGRDAVVQVLLAGGADPNRPDRGPRVRPLHTATGEGRVTIVRRLLRAGANPNVRVRGMDTPLHLAAGLGHLRCVRALVRAGASVTARNEEGHLAIDSARDNGHTGVVAFLTEVGAA